jgi:hypothetical protein
VDVDVVVLVVVVRALVVVDDEVLVLVVVTATQSLGSLSRHPGGSVESSCAEQSS